MNASGYSRCSGSVKDVPVGSRVFMRRLMGDLGTPKDPIFSCACVYIGLHVQNATARRVRSGILVTQTRVLPRKGALFVV